MSNARVRKRRQRRRMVNEVRLARWALQWEGFRENVLPLWIRHCSRPLVRRRLEALRGELPVEDVHVAVSPEAVDEVLNKPCG